MTAQHSRALVTGATGFIGGHLWERLLEAGVDATGLDIAPPRRPLRAGARLQQVDIRDASAVRAAFEETRPDVVYHLAAQASVSISMREPNLDIETNVLGSVNLLQAAIEVGAKRFVFFSSGGAVFGAPEVIPVDESREPHPLSIYGASKLAAERFLELLAAPTDIELSIVRPGNVYGPWQDPHGEAGVVAIFSQRMLAGEPATIFGDGSQRRDYVYVGDVVEAAVCAGRETPSTCVIGTGVATSTSEVFDGLAALCDYERPPVFEAERPGDIPAIALDPARAREVWGWTPRVSFEEGLAQTVEFFRAKRA